MSRYEDSGPSGSTIAAWGVVGMLTLALSVGGGMYGCPQYNVYSSRLDGEAQLAKAQAQREVIVRTAQAKRDAAKYEAEAEIEKAKGVAKANEIIGSSLKDNEAYLRWLWIESVKEGKDGNTIIYIPTEANLPILEADRFTEDRKAHKGRRP